MLPDALRFLLISWNDENTAKDFDPSTEAYPLAVILFCLTMNKDLSQNLLPCYPAHSKSVTDKQALSSLQQK
jgi:hypothetical protein